MLGRVFFFVDAVMRSGLYSFSPIRSARTPAPCRRRVWALASGTENIHSAGPVYADVACWLNPVTNAVASRVAIDRAGGTGRVASYLLSDLIS